MNMMEKKVLNLGTFSIKYALDYLKLILNVPDLKSMIYNNFIDEMDSLSSEIDDLFAYFTEIKCVEKDKNLRNSTLKAKHYNKNIKNSLDNKVKKIIEHIDSIKDKREKESEKGNFNFYYIKNSLYNIFHTIRTDSYYSSIYLHDDIKKKLSTYLDCFNLIGSFLNVLREWDFDESDSFKYIFWKTISTERRLNVIRKSFKETLKDTYFIMAFIETGNELIKRYSESNRDYEIYHLQNVLNNPYSLPLGRLGSFVLVKLLRDIRESCIKNKITIFRVFTINDYYLEIMGNIFVFRKRNFSLIDILDTEHRIGKFITRCINYGDNSFDFLKLEFDFFKPKGIDTSKILAIDLETTDLDIHKAKIVQISAYLLDITSMNFTLILSSYVKESENMRLGDCFISNYIDHEKYYKKAVLLDDFSPVIAKLLGTYPATSYKTSYDLNLLKVKGFKIACEMPCIMETAKYIIKIPHYEYGYKYPSLAEATRYFFPDEELKDLHDANEDAKKAVKILSEMIKREQYDLSKLKGEEENGK